jgi:hypothetical protein
VALASKRRSIVIPALAALVTGCGATPLDAVAVDPRSLAIGLVAHWTFDEGSGVVVGDQSGNGHDGQLTGGTWTGTGRFGGALELALGDFVTVPDFPQATPSWTVSTWTQASPTQLAADTSDTATVLSTENVFAGGWQVHLDARAGYKRYDAAYWAGSTVNDYDVVYCQCIVESQWVHLTAVFDDAAGQLSLYQDDVVTDRMNLPIPVFPGDSTLYMGKWNMNGRFLAADLDDVAIWSRALTAGEIAVLSRQAPPDSF